MSFPDFVGVGALKAGSTYLDSLLRQHALASMPHIKETNYFSSKYDLGPLWYARQFRRRAEHLIAGEVCPTYITHRDAPHRIARANPEIKIIVTLRHPYDRLVSQFNHWCQETGYAGDLAQYLVDHPNALAASKYAQCMEPWLDRFPASAIHFVLFEDLTTKTIETIGKVYQFVGLDDGYIPADLYSGRYATTSRRYARGRRLAKSVKRSLADHGYGKALAINGLPRLSDLLLAPVRQSLVRPVKLPNFAKEEIRKDSEALRAMTPWDPVETWDLASD